LALGKTGIPAERTWIIGDNYDTDIVGGKNAGLFTMLFCPKYSSYVKLSLSVMFSSFSALHHQILKLL
jgi:FMN phosphatase YigB (HAD superfamily)